MDALEFAKQKRRMCNSNHCSHCRFINTQACSVLGYVNSTIEHDIDLVDEVEKWAKEHPEKTRQSDFLKMFPYAPLKDGCLLINPCEIDAIFTFDLLKDSRVDCSKQTCGYCRHKYWLAPLEDQS